MILCDYATVAEGKLYLSGGGWTVTGPDPSPSAIAALIEVPWDRTNRRINFRLRLLNEDGEQVTQPTADGSMPIEMGVEVEVGRPPGAIAGDPLPVPMQFNLPPLLLTPGMGYYWQAQIDGEQRHEWRCSFRTRRAPTA